MTKNIKRISALILILALVAGMLPKMTMLSKASEGHTEAVVYVSATGNDSNAGTEGSPFATMSQAITKLNQETADSKIIYISGEVAVTNDVEIILPSHTDTIQVKAVENTGAKFKIGDANLVLGGPIDFEDITIHAAGGQLFALGNELTFGENVTVTTASGQVLNVVTGTDYYKGLQAGVASHTYLNRHKINIKNGAINMLYLGGKIAHRDGGTIKIPGVTMNMDGGTVNMVRFFDSGSQKSTYQYTDDVNIVLNSGNISTNMKMANSLSKVNFVNGAAVQLILNNGITLGDKNLLTSDVQSLNVAYYELRSENAEGCRLEPTETAGVYKIVDGNQIATATNINDTSKVYISENGMLGSEASPLPAGTYNVTWTKSTEEAVVYVSASGNDSNAGTESSPVATVGEAITKLNQEKAISKIIYIIGEVAVTSDAAVTLPSHTDSIQVKAVENTGAKFKIGDANLVLGGPIDFEDITIHAAGGQLLALGNELTFGENVTITTASGQVLNVSTGTHYYAGLQSGVASHTYLNRHKINIKNGAINILYLGGEVAHRDGGTIKIPGVTMNMDGGTVNMVRFFDSGSQKSTYQYTDDVNIVLNGGSLSTNMKMANSLTKVSFVDGAAVQLILNNGITLGDKNLLTSDVQSLNVAYYELRSEEAEGSRLEPTATAGVYQIVDGNQVATATDVNDTNKVYISENGMLGSEASPLPAGIYNVTWEEPAEAAAAVYVSASGNDSNAGTESSPFATMSQAITKLNQEKAVSKIIYIIGEVAVTSDTAVTLPSHTDTIQVTAAEDTGAKFKIGDANLVLGGPIDFEDITIHAAGGQLFALGHELTFGENVTITTASGQVLNVSTGTDYYAGLQAGEASHTYPNRHKINIKNGALNILYLGGKVAHRSGGTIKIPGVTMNMDGGTVGMVRFFDSSSQQSTYQYTDDVNIVLNGGKINTNVKMANSLSKVSFVNGAAVQLILNNGITLGDKNLLTSEVQSLNVAYYELRCAEQDGSYLQPTEIAGVYRVFGAKQAIATNVEDESKVYTSSNGTLGSEASPLPAGTYNVTWVKPTDDRTYYVSVNGDDSTGDGTQENPFATINQAIKQLEMDTSGKKTVCLLTDTTVSDEDCTFIAHTEMITIKGITQSVALKFSSTVYANGPLTFDEITIKDSTKEIFAQGASVVFGENMITSNSTLSVSAGSNYKKGKPENNTYKTEHNITINSGKFASLFVGEKYSNENFTVPGATITMNGGSVECIYFGSADFSSYTGKSIFNKNLNFVMNGGEHKVNVQLKNIEFKDGAALQFIFNNGTTPGRQGFLYEAADVIAKGGMYYRLNCEKGIKLVPTDTAGVYNVVGDVQKVYTIAANGQAIVATNGQLDVSAAGAGTYEVYAYDNYINTGSQLIVKGDKAIDLSQITGAEVDGKLFVGWNNDENEGNVTGNTAVVFEVGTILEAQYIDFDAEAEFSFNGVQVKKVVNPTSDEQTLRFNMKLDSAFLNRLDVNATYGTLLIRSSQLGNFTLEYDSTNGVKESENSAELTLDTPGVVNKENKLSVDVTTSAYNDLYTVRSYIQYTDINGFAQVLYSDYTMDSVYTTAKLIQEKVVNMDTTDEAYFEAIINAVDEANPYFIASRVDIAETSFASRLKDATTANAFNAQFYVLNNDLVVREITIGDKASGKEPVEIVQLTDTHLNAISEKDLNNKVAMQTYLTRSFQRDGGLKEGGNLVALQKAMQYGSLFDQVVVTGDVVDYLTYGALDLARRNIWESNKNTMVSVGNHEFYYNMGVDGDIADEYSLESKYDILNKNWLDAVDYSSKLLNGKVLLIQMDNGNGFFSESQIDKLQADLTLAKQEQYTVLLFVHKPLATGQSGSGNVTPIYSKSSSKPSWDYIHNGVGYDAEEGSATKVVYDLITSNADIIKGVFAGHEHEDYYTMIQGTGDNAEKTIPQYVTSATFEGNVAKIVVY